MNLFVQKRTGLNQLIHFSDIVGRNKYTFHKLPLSCFLARLSRRSNLILSRERERHAGSTVLSGKERRGLYRHCGWQTVLAISLWTYRGPFRSEHHILYCSSSVTPFKVFLPWQLFSLKDLAIHQLVGIKNNSATLSNTLCWASCRAVHVWVSPKRVLVFKPQERTAAKVLSDTFPALAILLF